MSSRNLSLRSFIISALIALFLTGCAGSVKHMQEAAPGSVVQAPAADKAMVVFMRPSGMAYAIQSSVFDVAGDSTKLVGIVAAKKKVAYELTPGKHLFMVVGEAADFMSAELDAGKTYYALVTPRMGLWKARFSLQPVHAAELGTPQFDEWMQECAWVEKTADSEQWMQENRDSIEQKRQEYYAKWMGKSPAERPALMPQDGMAMK